MNNKQCRGARIILAALLLAAALATGFAGHSVAAGQGAPSKLPATVILLRHAEKTTEPKADPVLTPAGEERAKLLARVLSNAGVTGLYATQFKRTQLTLKPLAAMLNLPITVVNAQDNNSLLQKMEAQAGGVVVIAGHSNTIGPIIEALGGPKQPDLDDAAYDNLFVVTIAKSGQVTVVNLKYGSASSGAMMPSTPMKPL